MANSQRGFIGGNMADGKYVVAPGMNAIKCNACKDGTVFVSVTMEEMAKLRASRVAEITAKCHLGHTQNLMISGWPLSWGRLTFNRA